MASQESSWAVSIGWQRKSPDAHKRVAEVAAHASEAGTGGT